MFRAAVYAIYLFQHPPESFRIDVYELVRLSDNIGDVERRVDSLFMYNRRLS